MKYLALYFILIILLIFCQSWAINKQDILTKSLLTQDSIELPCQVPFEMIPFKEVSKYEDNYNTIEMSSLNDLKWVGINIDTVSMYVLSQSSEIMDTVFLKVFEGLGVGGTYLYYQEQDSIIILSLSYEYVDVLHLFKLQNKQLSYLAELALEVDYQKLKQEGSYLREDILPMTAFQICKIGEKEIQCQHPDLAVSKKIQLRE